MKMYVDGRNCHHKTLGFLCNCVKKTSYDRGGMPSTPK